MTKLEQFSIALELACDRIAAVERKRYGSTGGSGAWRFYFLQKAGEKIHGLTDKPVKIEK